MSDGQWAAVEPVIPQAEPGGQPRKAETRELVHAIVYFRRAGGSWRLLQHDLPPWQVIFAVDSAKASETGVHHTTIMADSERVGR